MCLFGGISTVVIVVKSLRTLQTEDNERIICLEFQKIIVNDPKEKDVSGKLDTRLRQRFGRKVLDSWGQPLSVSYHVNAKGADIRVSSAGPDRRAGTGDDIAISQRFSPDGQVLSDEALRGPGALAETRP
jgi:hypothetical protein